ncbi:PREDICTED: dixin [Nanorana parkeri]|uniref:dixin n=1 Tax=Nanorana parkeri TaxID=125878 RepID=UPI000854EA47|nr:PREDICTED: dixin [Nanorana parkeri]
MLSVSAQFLSSSLPSAVLTSLQRAERTSVIPDGICCCVPTASLTTGVDIKSGVVSYHLQMMIAYLARGNLQDILNEGFPEQQLQAYVAWVNSQLKKKAEVNPVQDLRLDLRDGVALGHLIEIVAGEKLDGIHWQPSSTQEMKANVDKVLQFMASKKIRMHQTTAKDIVDGNLKSIMRIILTLAAHFKPVSGRSINHNVVGASGKSQSICSTNHRPQSTTAVAQGAAAALADVRLDMSRSGRDVSRYRQRNGNVEEEIGNPYWSVRAMVKQYEGHQGSASPSESSGLTSPSPVHSSKSEVNDGAYCEDKAEITIIQCEENLSKKDESFIPPPESQPISPGMYPDTSWEDHLLEQQDHLEREMEEAKKMISGLQALLLNGSLPEDEQESLFSLREDGACPEEQLVIIKSRLDQSMSENQCLKKELQNCKQENRNLQAIKDALQQRMAQQESSVLQLKQELLRTNMDKDELHNQNVDLQRKLEERNQLNGEYKKEITQKDWLIQQMQGKLDEAHRKLSEANYQKVSNYISHPAQTNGFLQSAGKGPARDPIPQRTANDLQLVRDALRSLRNGFSGHDPQHHTIDSLEQGIASLMDRLHAIETQKRQDRKARGRVSGNKDLNEYRDSWPPNSKMPHSQSAPIMGSSNSCTKVLYFTDRSLTPFMVTIPKRLGEVTLRDFKIAIDREGNHRYHFKALDPEFGTVKEEVFHDDDIIPGWEGKIVAWVEEDHGTN